MKLSRTSVNETRKAGVKVADLEAVDEDSTTQYELIDGIASADNDKHEIVVDDLIVDDSINYDRQTDYFICVRATDAQGDVREEALRISVEDIPGLVLKPNHAGRDQLTGLATAGGASASHNCGCRAKCHSAVLWASGRDASAQHP